MDAAQPLQKRNLIIYAAVGVVIVLLIAYLLSNTSLSTSSLYNTTVGATELSTLNTIANNQTLANKVGISTYAGLAPSYFMKPSTNTTLSSNGKPELLYLGAEFCPYCAAARWSLVLALMRFGSVSGLIYSQSSATDVYPNTPTFSFVNTSYTSNYISFVSYETETRTQTPLQTPDSTSEAVYLKYGNAIPFFDFGNKYIESGSLLTPGVLKGLSWDAITTDLYNSNASITPGMIGAANIYTAQICTMINNSAPVCSQSYVKAAQSRVLPAS